MKKSLRFASAALALTLAASMTMPAFAAGKSDFAKSENVYAVMNADGSIKSTTVSEHLYNANGLSGVTDVSSLTDIQNTESDAAFTQDGESWSGTPTTPTSIIKGPPTVTCPSRPKSPIRWMA